MRIVSSETDSMGAPKPVGGEEEDEDEAGEERRDALGLADAVGPESLVEQSGKRHETFTAEQRDDAEVAEGQSERVGEGGARRGPDEGPFDEAEARHAA